MEGKIVQVKKGDKVYCYYKRSYRVKVDPAGKGKTKGTGKSKVIFETIYLGTLEAVVKKLTGVDINNISEKGGKS
jgi:hypothetical protein